MTTMTVQKQASFETLQQIAESQKQSLDDLLDLAVQEYLERWNDQKLHAEQEAFERLHTTLVAKHFGRYVAIHNGEVVDHDPDARTLHLRIRHRFGQMPVLLRKVTESAQMIELFHRSPRFEPITP